MRRIALVALGLLSAAPAFAAKPHHRPRPAVVTPSTGTATKPVAQAPAGEAKPAEGTKGETPKKHTGKRHNKKETAAPAPAEGTAK
jgi:hypothetical protein